MNKLALAGLLAGVCLFASRDPRKTRTSNAVLMTTAPIDDGMCILQPSKISVAAAEMGDPVTIGVNPPLETGLEAYGKVTAPGVVSVELCNLSHPFLTQRVGSATYRASISQ